jgi:xylan 1,4-beta-xylosidase
MLVDASDRKYEVQVEYTMEGEVTTGLCLFYDEHANVRIAASADNFAVFIQKSRKIRERNTLATTDS